MATIFVDNKEIQAKENSLLIDVLLENGINIPHFCYHKALGKDGNCRMCMVEIKGQKRPQIACDTPVSDGQVIFTKGEKIDRVKKNILELELINHPIDCPICDQAGECKLQDYYMDVGLYESRLDTPKVKAKKHQDLGCSVVLDQERCVLCTRCVRFTQNITKTHELGVFKRADRSVISTFPNKKLNNPYAMNVVDLCPVGALTSGDFRFSKRVWFLQNDEGICDGCSRGCNIYVDHHKKKYGDDMIYRFRPRLNGEVNGHFICDYGRLSYKKFNENRLFTHRFGSENMSLNECIYEIKSIFEGELNMLFLISSNLSIEEMLGVKMLANRYGADLLALAHTDESFGDDFLRRNDRSLNRRGAEILGIKIANSSQKELLKSYGFTLFVGLKDMPSWVKAANEKEKKYALIDSFTCDDDKGIFSLAMAAHSEREGSFLTYNDIFQLSKSKVVKNQQAPKLNEICASILQMEYEQLMQDIKSEISSRFEAFMKEPK